MRFIAQKLVETSKTPPLVWLYMLERAMDG